MLVNETITIEFDKKEREALETVMAIAATLSNGYCHSFGGKAKTNCNRCPLHGFCEINTIEEFQKKLINCVED